MPHTTETADRTMALEHFQPRAPESVTNLPSYTLFHCWKATITNLATTTILIWNLFLCTYNQYLTKYNYVWFANKIFSLSVKCYSNLCDYFCIGKSGNFHDTTRCNISECSHLHSSVINVGYFSALMHTARKGRSVFCWYACQLHEGESFFGNWQPFS